MTLRPQADEGMGRGWPGPTLGLLDLLRTPGLRLGGQVCTAHTQSFPAPTAGPRTAQEARGQASPYSSCRGGAEPRAGEDHSPPPHPVPLGRPRPDFRQLRAAAQACS